MTDRPAPTRSGTTRFHGQEALILWLLFLVFPVLVAVVFGRSLVAYVDQGNLYQARLHLRQSLHHLNARTDPERFVQWAFTDPEVFSRAPFPQAILFKKSKDRFPTYLCVAGDEPTHDEQAAMSVLADLLAKTSTVTAASLAQCRKLLGFQFDVGQALLKPGEAIPVRWHRQPAWLIWQLVVSSSEPDQMRMGLVVSPARRTAMTFLLQTARIDDFAGCLMDLDPSGQLRPVCGKSFAMPLSFQRRLIAGERANEAWEARQGRMFFLAARTDDRLVLVGRFPLSAYEWQRAYQFLPWLGVILLAVGTLGRNHLWEAFRGSSVAGKVFVVFVWLIIVPFLAGGSFTLQAYQARTSVVRAAELQKARNELHLLDESFSQEAFVIQEEFRRFLQLPALLRGEMKNVRQAAQKLYDQRLADFISIRGWENELFVVVPEAERFSDRVESGNVLSEFGLRTIERSKNAQPTAQLQEQSAIVQAYMQDREMDGDQPRIFRGRVGTSGMFSLTQIARDRTQPFFSIHVGISLSQAIRNFFSRNLIRNRRYRIFAHERNTGTWFPDLPDTSFGSGLHLGLDTQDPAAVARIQFQGEPSFLVGIPGRNLEGFDVFALIPEFSMEPETRSLRRNVRLGFVLALGTGLACAFLLTGGLLRPVSELVEGVIAVREHRTEFRVPVQGEDEMAQVALAFNRMMETLSELSQAKSVQKLIIHTSAPNLEDWELGFFINMSSAIGGGFCECVERPSGERLLVFGEATDRGVPAAMRMAMVKTCLFHAVRRGLPTSELPVFIHDNLGAVSGFGQGFRLGILRLGAGGGKVTVEVAGVDGYLMLNPRGVERNPLAETPPLGCSQECRTTRIDRELLPEDILLVTCTSLSLLEHALPDSLQTARPEENALQRWVDTLGASLEVERASGTLVGDTVLIALRAIRPGPRGGTDPC